MKNKKQKRKRRKKSMRSHMKLLTLEGILQFNKDMRLFQEQIDARFAFLQNRVDALENFKNN